MLLQHILEKSYSRVCKNVLQFQWLVVSLPQCDLQKKGCALMIQCIRKNHAHPSKFLLTQQGKLHSQYWYFI